MTPIKNRDEYRRPRLAIHSVCLVLLACAWLSGCGDAESDPANPGPATDSAQADAPGQGSNPAGGEKTNGAVTQSSSTPGTFNLEIVPHDAAAILGVQIGKVIGQEGMESYGTLLQELIFRDQKLDFAEMDQLIVATPPVKGKARPNQGAIIFTLKKDAGTDAAGLIRKLSRGAATESTYNGQPIQQTKSGAFYRVNDRTVVMGLQSDVKWFIDSQKTDGQDPAWLASAKSLATMDGLFAIDASQLAEQMSKMPQGASSSMQMFAPLWQEPVTIVGGISLSGRLSYRIVANCSDEKGAEKVLNTVNSLIPLGKNMLDGAKANLEKIPPRAREAASVQTIFVGMAEDFLNNFEATQSGTQVTVSTSTDTDIAKTVMVTLMPAVMQAREAARRSQAKNNLKQIGIALHNYHETHGHFPSPTNVGPDGETVHSWRVAILPFLDETELYSQYKRDEPWNSEHNRQLLARIPKPFRNPNASGDESHSSCFAVTGTGTAMPVGPKGLGVKDMTDGNSNTILIVEAQREIPWTKPEDIPYDAEKEVPKFGGYHKGGFNVLLCDGAVRFVSERIAKDTLRNLITRDDGNAVGRF